MTLQALIDQLQALAHGEHAQEEVLVDVGDEDYDLKNVIGVGISPFSNSNCIHICVG